MLGPLPGRVPGLQGCRCMGFPTPTRTPRAFPPVLNTPMGPSVKLSQHSPPNTGQRSAFTPRTSRDTAASSLTNEQLRHRDCAWLTADSPEEAEPEGIQHTHRHPGWSAHAHVHSHHHAHSFHQHILHQLPRPLNTRRPQALARVSAQPHPGAGFSSVATMTCPQLSPARSTEDAITQLRPKGRARLFGSELGFQGRGTLCPLCKGGHSICKHLCLS